MNCNHQYWYVVSHRLYRCTRCGDEMTDWEIAMGERPEHTEDQFPTERCDSCGAELQIGDWPWCPHGRPSANFYAPDDIPGGLTLENLGRDPVTVYSHSERRAIMRARGLEEFVRHRGTKGSDKSPHTTDWSRGSIDAKTLDNARVLVSRQNCAAAREIETPDHIVTSGGRVLVLSLRGFQKGVLDHE